MTDKLTSELALMIHETNDCTVKAIMYAYDITYSDAHKLCERYGRRPRGGFQFQAKMAADLKLILHDRLIGHKVSSVLEVLDGRKTYLCLVNGHIFCIKQGKVKDTLDNGQKTIIRLWEIPQR